MSPCDLTIVELGAAARQEAFSHKLHPPECVSLLSEILFDKETTPEDKEAVIVQMLKIIQPGARCEAAERVAKRYITDYAKIIGGEKGDKLKAMLNSALLCELFR